MLKKQKTEKNSMIPLNSVTRNILTKSKLNSKSNSYKSANKFNIKRIKYNSISNFIDKKKVDKNKKLNQKKINLPKPQSLTEKNKKILKRINNSKKNDNMFNIYKLNNFLKSGDLKQTIIIDNEGNNNLDLIINKNNKNPNEKSRNKREKININEKNKNELTNLHLDSNFKHSLIKKNLYQTHNTGINYNFSNINNNNIKKENNQEKKTNKDNQRLSEYSQIFKLLNENIEQFKNIFRGKNSNLENNNNKNNNINNNGNSPNKLKFLSIKENYKNENIKKIKNIENNEKMEEIASFNKIQEPSLIKNNKNNNNLNKKNLEGNNKDKNNSINKSYSCNFSKENVGSEIYSFLESFTQDDLFLPLAIKHQKKSSKSLTNILKVDKKESINRKEIKKDLDKISSNDISTNKCYEDEEMQLEICGIDEQINCDEIKNRDINPHFFSKDFNNINNKNKDKKISLERDCYIF